MSDASVVHPQLFTIGHSTHEWPAFVALLRKHSISTMADVRSSPYSRFNPQYNREALERGLNEAGIQYVFMGRELGARRDESECYEGRQARYENIARTPLFLEGIDRVRKGAAEHRIALMCAEKDPITCHRMVLVGRALRTDGLELLHILEDGSIEANADAERRMVSATGLPESDLFRSREELVEEAYRQQGLRIAWVDPEDDSSGRTTPVRKEDLTL